MNFCKVLMCLVLCLRCWALTLSVASQTICFARSHRQSKAVLCYLPFQFPSAALRHIHRLLSFILFSMSVIHLLFMYRCSFLPLTPRKQPKIFCSFCKTNTLKKKAWCKISGVQQCGDVLLAWALNKPLVFHCCPCIVGVWCWLN